MQKTYIYVGLGILAAFLVGYTMKRDGGPLGSVGVSNEYSATTTSATANQGSMIITDTVVRTGNGALGSVVITGANTGVVNFYNATTTDVGKRTGNPATSTILIATLPASLAAGTYTFDAKFTTGLLIDLDSGLMPTTTVTYR